MLTSLLLASLFIAIALASIIHFETLFKVASLMAKVAVKFVRQIKLVADTFGATYQKISHQSLT